MARRLLERFARRIAAGLAYALDLLLPFVQVRSRERLVEFWRGGVIPNLVMLGVLLAAIGIVRRRVRPWARLGVPDSIAAGALGLGVGPSALDLAPLDPRELELDVVGRWLAPILLMSLVGGLVTLVACVWLARRAFPEAPFAHTLVLFGTATGTMPTGFALLRMVDPELRGPVARSTVVAATASIPIGAPLFVGVIPFVVSRWSGGFWPSVWVPLGIAAIYLVVLLAVARRLTPFRALRPFASMWPPVPESKRSD